jgi:hypothetical protein
LLRKISTQAVPDNDDGNIVTTIPGAVIYKTLQQVLDTVISNTAMRTRYYSGIWKFLWNGIGKPEVVTILRCPCLSPIAMLALKSYYAIERSD